MRQRLSIGFTVPFVMACFTALSPSPAQVATAPADRKEQSRRAVREMFPIVTLFERKSDGNHEVTEAVAASAASLADDRAAEDPYGTSAEMIARLRQIDVAGVRLGMTPEQTKAALRTSGYRPKPSKYHTDRRPEIKESYDYHSGVNQMIGMRTKDFSSKLTNAIVAETWQKDGEQEILIEYTPLRNGRQVTSVLYSIPEVRISWERIKDTVLQKYGQPSRLSENLKIISYCGDAACRSLSGNHAKLTTELMYSDWWLKLSDGGAAERLRSAQTREDAERLIVNTDRPTF